MVVAMYKENRKYNPEHIRVHKWRDNTLHIEGITNSYAHEIGGTYNTLEEVEAFLKQRSKPWGYSLIIKL
jgi:hypothetical protein